MRDNTLNRNHKKIIKTKNISSPNQLHKIKAVPHGGEGKLTFTLLLLYKLGIIYNEYMPN